MPPENAAGRSSILLSPEISTRFSQSVAASARISP
jgi:hypothetical protein